MSSASPHSGRRALGERVAGEAAAGVDLVHEEPGFDAGIVVHDPLRLIDRRIEDADAVHVAAVAHGTDDREQAVGAQGEIPPPVLPDDLVPAPDR